MAEDRNTNDNQPRQPVNITPNQAVIGLNLENVLTQVKPGMLTYALNCQKANFDGNAVQYQNEQANELCVKFPDGYKVVGREAIIPKGIVVVFLANDETGDSEIGKVITASCEYQTVVNSPCLGFSIDRPIHKVQVKITNCSTEIYWTDGGARKFLDLDNIPYKKTIGNNNCDVVIETELDCNRILVQPDFAIPQIEAIAVDSDGDNIAGTYQFAAQYSNALGEGYTSFYSVTNPLPLFDPNKITQDFNFHVGKSVRITISNLDTTGYYDYYNLAVIKTVNDITSVELVGTYQISGSSDTVSYTGQNKQEIKLSIDDIFQKYPVYTAAKDSTSVQDILIWDQLTSQERISYQQIANKITLQWQTWRVDGNKTYANELNATYLRGYMRDEVYPYEVVFLLKNGWQTDGFHIPGRVALADDLVAIANNDVFPASIQTDCTVPAEAKPKWQVYNTGCLSGYEPEFTNFLYGNPQACKSCTPAEDINPSDPKCYVGPHQYGCFAYWESTETYPCNQDEWGELAGKPIRHHKFPDSTITHIHDSDGYVYPIGVKIDIQQIKDLILNSSLTKEQISRIAGFKIVRGNRANNKSVVAKGLINNVGKYTKDGSTYYFPNYLFNDLRPDPFLSTVKTAEDSKKNISTRLDAFSTDESKQRYTLHSPDTSFYQPFLGNILKLETAEFGQSKSQVFEVLNHAKYKFPSLGSYMTSLVFGVAVGILSATVGVSDQIFDGTAAFTAFSVINDIVEKTIPKKNFAYQINAVGEYTDFKPIENNGNKQRFADLSLYLNPGNFGVGDIHAVNNFQRESSVYIRTTKTLPFPNEVPGVPEDQSKWIEGDNSCSAGPLEKPISSYYASLKNNFDNQYGQLYSYETIDTGFQFMIDWENNYQNIDRYRSVFGGDIFINRFAYKSKIPFFIDNRVYTQNGVNNSTTIDNQDIFYDELSNVAYSIFWFSTDVRADSTDGGGGIAGAILNSVKQFFGVKANNFDCPGSKYFYQDGKIYLFAYGIPYFYCESEVNVDLRQAFNDREGDFFPRVSSDIPNDWLQEKNVTIAQDNTYYYNRTFSKQNKENEFSHLPEGWKDEQCLQEMPFRAIFSEKQLDLINYRRNNWLIYKPESKFDFPEIYGKLVSLEGGDSKSVLARFENKSLQYNSLLTSPTSAGEVYLGKSLFSEDVPPIDFMDTDMGYGGTQHKFFLKTEYGMVSCDAKRGDIFLYPRVTYTYMRPQIIPITGELDLFATQYMDFEIQKAFPNYPIDNHFKGVGLHGVYDNKYKRLIITKLDYSPIDGVTYDGSKLYYEGNEIQIGDPNYFCNRSFTLSYDFTSKTWISFHTYLPNYYVPNANYFYSGKNDEPALWRHNTSLKFNNFYGKIEPYVLEYPFAYKYNDEILQSIKDYTKCYQYFDTQTYIETDDVYFSKAICWNNQQSTGVLKLVKKPSHNLSEYKKYPIYNSDSKEILYTKSGNFYNFNTMWGLTKNPRVPIWNKSCESLSIFKELNQSNCDYGKRSFKKEPIRAKDLRVRFILDDRDDTKMVSTFIVAQTQESFK